MLAAGCDSYQESERQSFLARAAEHLMGARVTLTWLNGTKSTCPLDTPVSPSLDTYPRARYLSQQFVEHLCSIEGMPTLIREIERVIFEAHPSLKRDGAVDFEEFRELKTSQYRDVRRREEAALAAVSDQIGIELDKSRQVPALKVQISEKEKLVARYDQDRKNLLPQGQNDTSERLQTLIAAAEKVRGYLRYYAAQQASLVALKSEVLDVRQHQAPSALRSMKERHSKAALESSEWERFLLDYSGHRSETLHGLNVVLTGHVLISERFVLFSERHLPGFRCVYQELGSKSDRESAYWLQRSPHVSNFSRLEE